MNTTTSAPGGTREVTEEEIAAEWRERARRTGLRRVMRSSQPDSLNAGVTEQTRAVVAQQLTLVADRLGRRPRHVWEIGCGIGRLTPTIAAHAERVHAIDMTPAMLDQARVTCRHLPAVEFERVRADRMRPPLERYDAAVCVWVLMHVLGESRLLDTCRVIAESTRHLTLIEYEHARVPVSKWSRLRTLDDYVRLLPGAEVVDERVVDYGGDRSFAALIAIGGQDAR
ncbi:class I SAM-dependent methyltransferase [Amycolatopsis vancoresmycina]|uniref:Type 11 methyltransferase n=1 Tax=Amycolatopsis vancoresmycina DSM 44592 TaxID=1292037 RepID=R1HS14_9PSEU|nr:class I SAM-dependent methyltransferase [Amycolatopsis vancoresmycina]EOD66355.1 type 11 methyltransferase [Amycolatopsis vancoresmycina DSM 44592]